MATVKDAQSRGRTAYLGGAALAVFVVMVGGRIVVVSKDQPGARPVPSDRVVTIDVPIEDCTNACPSVPQCRPVAQLSALELLCCIQGDDRTRIHRKDGKGRKVVGLVSGWAMEPYMDNGEAKCRLHVQQSGKQRAAWALLPPGQRTKIREVLGADDYDGGG